METINYQKDPMRLGRERARAREREREEMKENK